MDSKLKERISSVADWVGRHASRLGWALLALVVGLSVGWWAGSFTACAQDKCHARTDAIEALGTWVGGLGTVAAVMFAIVGYRSEERARREDEQTRIREQIARDDEKLADQRRTEARLVAQAQDVHLKQGPVTWSNGDGRLESILCSVTNGTAGMSIYKVRVPDDGALVTSSPVLAAGEATDSFKVPNDVGDEVTAEGLLSKVTFSFVMEGRSFRRVGRERTALVD
ncbi:hypothetical protein ACIA49_19595 [Kribbella sp. NPDC051587]|uniref:hypothetical protein n=1 Tax=Kribbella sp. NPDC051587 TaxID=3364119 RepID=UPI00379CB630